jgi:hypothetical protein
MPLARPSTVLATKPAVSYPAACRSSASVACASSSRNPALSRTPCRNGSSPVIIELCAGSVIGQVVRARSKRTADFANASRRGVFAAAQP